MTLNELRKGEVEQLAKVPAEDLATMQTTLARKAGDLAALSERLRAVLEARYGRRAKAELRKYGKGHGQVTFADGAVKVAARHPMSWSWSQDKLDQAWQRLKDLGEEPTEYIQQTLSASRDLITKGPAWLRQILEPACEGRPGRPTYTLELPRKAD